MLTSCFNLNKAQTFLQENPLDIHLALAEGFKESKVDFNPFTVERKRNYFTAIEDEFLNPEKLERFKSKVEGEPENAGRTTGEAKNLKNKLNKATCITDALEIFDSEVRLYMLSHFINPIKKILEPCKARIHEIMTTQLRRVGLMSTISISEDQAWTEFTRRIKDATLNAGSQFMALLSLIPNVYKRQTGKLMPEAKLLEATENITNLLERYARINVGHFRIIRDYALCNKTAQQNRVNKYGKGDTEMAKILDYEKNDTAPCFEIYYKDSFDLIDTDKGLQVANNAKALERFNETIMFPSQGITKELTEAKLSPAIGCPALRIKFSDGQNLVELISKWLTKSVKVYLLPIYKKFGVIV